MTGKRFKLSHIFIPAAVMFLNAAMVLFPKETAAAARDGFSLWFLSVFPSLLPFIIGVGLLLETGAVSFLGVTLEPLTRLLFNVPGGGGMALLSGLMSGSPMGAKVACELRENGGFTKHEAQRLIAFSNNAGLPFILGAVAAGMFNNIYAGHFIFTAHVVSAVLVGVVFRFYGTRGENRWSVRGRRGKTLPRAYRAMAERRKLNPRFSAIFNRVVMKSTETMLLVGGFIVFFCVVIRVFEATGVFGLVSGSLPLSENSREALDGILTGIVEISNGCRRLGEMGASKGILVSAAAIVSWGGFSIHAQALSFINKTDISPAVYILSKVLHAAVAALVGFAVYTLFKGRIESAASVEVSSDPAGFASFPAGFFGRLAQGTAYLGLALLFIAALALAANAVVFIIKKRGRHSRRPL